MVDRQTFNHKIDEKDVQLDERSAWLQVGGEKGNSATAVPSAGLPEYLPSIERRKQFLPRQALADIFIEEEAFGRLFLVLPICLGGGAAFWFAVPHVLSPYLICLFVGVTVLAAWSFHRRPMLFWVFAFLAVFGFGMASAAWETFRKDTVLLDGPVTVLLEGRIVDAEPARGGRWRYTLDVVSISDPALKRPPVRVRLTGLPPKAGGGLPGDILRGRARLQPPSGPALPGGYDFAFSFFYDGIGAVGFYYGYPQRVEAPHAAAGWAVRLKQFQAAVSLAISEKMKHVLSGDELAFAAAITINDRRALSNKALEALRNSGLAHIIAISGLHMALAAGLFFWLLRSAFALLPGFSQRFPVKKWAASGAMLAATCYLFISGAPVSATRAYIMLMVMLLAVIAGRHAFNLRNLAVAALLILLMKPSAVVSPGFQMSFAATAALIAAYRLSQGSEKSWFSGKSAGVLPAIFRLPANFVAGIAITSLVAGGATALVAAATFNTLPTLGLAANILVMPIFSLVVMPAALFSLIFMLFGAEAPALHVFRWGLDSTLSIAEWISKLSNVLYTGQVESGFLIVGTFALLLGCVLRSVALRLALIFAYVVILFAGIVAAIASAPPDVLIYEDGTLAAIRGRDGLAFSKQRPTGFVAQQWEKATRLKEVGGLRMINHLAAGEGVEEIRDDSFLCLKQKWCATRLANGSILMLIEAPGEIGFACDNADIVISRWRHKFRYCRSGAVVVDRESLRRNGSLALRVDEKTMKNPGLSRAQRFAGVKLTTSLGQDLKAWNRHRLFDWRTVQFGDSAENRLDGIFGQ